MKKGNSYASLNACDVSWPVGCSDPLYAHPLIPTYRKRNQRRVSHRQGTGKAKGVPGAETSSLEERGDEGKKGNYLQICQTRVKRLYSSQFIHFSFHFRFGNSQSPVIAIADYIHHFLLRQ